jgi:hypothetical protein
MLTYAGKGYTPRFVRGFDRIVAEMKRGRPIQLVAGPDDICAALTLSHKRVHCHSHDVRERDARALRDFRTRHLALTPPAPMTAARLRRLRKAYAANHVRTACGRCSWKALCDDLVRRDFGGCTLKGAAQR